MACEVAVGAVFNVSVRGKYNGVADINNVFQIRKTEGALQSLASAGLDIRDIFTDLYDLVVQICNVVNVFTGLEAQHLNGNCSTGFVPFTSPIAGALSTGIVPPGVAALFNFPTGYSRVSLRKYFGGLDKDVISAAGFISAGFVTQTDAIRDFLLAPLEANNSTWEYGFESPKAGTWVTPTGGVLNQVPAYQRRRRPGTGS